MIMMTYYTVERQQQNDIKDYLAKRLFSVDLQSHIFSFACQIAIISLENLSFLNDLYLLKKLIEKFFLQIVQFLWFKEEMNIALFSSSYFILIVLLSTFCIPQKIFSSQVYFIPNIRGGIKHIFHTTKRFLSEGALFLRKKLQNFFLPATHLYKNFKPTLQSSFHRQGHFFDTQTSWIGQIFSSTVDHCKGIKHV